MHLAHGCHVRPWELTARRVAQVAHSAVQCEAPGPSILQCMESLAWAGRMGALNTFLSRSCQAMRCRQQISRRVVAVQTPKRRPHRRGIVVCLGLDAQVRGQLRRSLTPGWGWVAR